MIQFIDEKEEVARFALVVAATVGGRDTKAIAMADSTIVEARNRMPPESITWRKERERRHHG